MAILTALLTVLRSFFMSRRRTALESPPLRQQLAVLKRKVPHPKLADRDRRFWLMMRAVHDGWRDCLHLVRPATIVRWHRQGFRWHWGRPAQGHKQGRPTIGWKLFCLIRRLQKENPTWGAPRITSELRLLGHEIGQMTVSRYMKRGRDPRRAQSWMTFLKNHAKTIAACDFFTVPTVTWRNLFVLVVLSHDRRFIRHVAVTLVHQKSASFELALRSNFTHDWSPPRPMRIRTSSDPGSHVADDWSSPVSVQANLDT